MYVVATKRVVKYNTGAVEQYKPRTANRTEWLIAGPFSKRATAERAAVSAMGTHTCLVAQVWSNEVLTAWKFPRYSNTGGIIRSSCDEELKAVLAAREALGIPELAGKPESQLTESS